MRCGRLTGGRQGLVMRWSFVVVGGLVAWLVAVASAAARDQHSSPGPGPSAEEDHASPAVVLGRLAEVTAQTVRGLEAAIHDKDAGLARRRADGYVQSMDALVEYVEDGEPAGMVADLLRLDDALRRQVRLLRRLVARSPRGLAQVVVTALAAVERARRVVRAAVRDAGRTRGHPHVERDTRPGRNRRTAASDLAV